MNKLILFVVVFALVVGGLYWNQKRQAVVPQSPDKPLLQPQLPKLPVPPKTLPQPELNVPDALKQAFKDASAANKRVLVFLTTDGCIFCDRARANVIPRLNIADFVYKETKDRQVVDHYKPEAFPTFIIFDKAGKELKRHTGFMTTVEMQLWLR